MTRQEHLDWCKQRAREYLAVGDDRQALMSMISDLGKHPETRKHPMLAIVIPMVFLDQMKNAEAVSRFIEGFQ